MEDDWGYPYFRRPPYGQKNDCFNVEILGNHGNISENPPEMEVLFAQHGGFVWFCCVCFIDVVNPVSNYSSS